MNKNLQILTIFGTRPEAVKMAPVVLELDRTAAVDAKVCITAQHREMLDQVLNIFHISPDIDLNLMTPDQSLAGITAAIFTELDRVLSDLEPDWILVQGDTTTVMAAALLGYYHQIKVGHIEAGLRTGDKWQPFPEEINRKVAGAVADLHFAPTEWSRQNLLNEGIPDSIIRVTGNPVIDALHYVAKTPPPEEVLEIFDQIGLARDLDVPGPRLILVTAHRRENFGQPLINICNAIKEIAVRCPDVHFVYPVHFNPNIQKPVHSNLDGIENVLLTKPLEYELFVHLMKRSYLILTDSGGLQEESPSLGKPVLVLREVTERCEAIEAGTAEIVGTQPERIIEKAINLLENKKDYERMSEAINPYGDGRASERIVSYILKEADN